MHTKPDLQLAHEAGADPMSMTQPELVRFVVSESQSAPRISNTARITGYPEVGMQVPRYPSD